jgi:hypothetical protein
MRVKRLYSRDEFFILPAQLVAVARDIQSEWLVGTDGARVLG